MKQLEILAPAGNQEMLGAAVFSGADAVYLGLTGFNARRTAGNFDADALAEAVRFCHARGVRVHVTLNTLVYASELQDLSAAVTAVANAGADAVIVDDLATARLVKEITPTLALHGSTQMSVHTPDGAKALAALGYARVILARECSLAEIREIVAASPIECEVFIHGAQCMSMSGQCMMSAFLGGRSGNRGACAGPCRLPFDTTPNLRPGMPGKACHLSLKDMDLVPHLKELMDAGVASVKIEGRLRTPEYAAACVASCRAAREGLPYDAALLRDIFSRSGFTDGYLTAKSGPGLFGVRTEADSAATRAAAPKARELFRRELPRVPLRFAVDFDPEGIKLTATDDDGHKGIAYSMDAPAPAQKDPGASIRRNLSKTGGTPFVVQNPETDIVFAGEPGFLPGSAWNEMRRTALEQLLKKRSEAAPHTTKAWPLPAFAEHPLPKGDAPAIAARFACVEQLPKDYADRLAWLIFPLNAAPAVPQALRAKTLLELPRARFGAQGKTAAALAACKDQGFAGVVANNIADLLLADDWPVYAGLGLNVTNPLAAQELADRGVRGLLVHPETPARAMAAIAPHSADGRPLPTAALCYSHLPLMLTRACPLHNLQSCANCPGAAKRHATAPVCSVGALRDRKGRDFPLSCSAPGFAGIRTVYNPVPLYMGERLTELPVDVAVAAFTSESTGRTAQILAQLFARQPFDSEFTRGLYYSNQG